MKLSKIVLATLALGLLSACTFQNTRYTTEVSSEQSSGWHLSDVQITVPNALTTSDVNLFQPDVDVVWHGDPAGDRKQQVAVILEDAIENAAKNMTGSRGVVIQATLIRFHSLTPKARTVIGGVHKVAFAIQVVDDKTGAILAGPDVIEADVEAFGGWQAVESDARGETPKLRISNRITEVVRSWLGLAGSDAVRQSSVLAIGH